MSPTNLIQASVFPRLWTIIANGCDASESAEFKLSGPVLFNAIDNTSTYAMFANEGNSFYSIDHFNYGNGGSFPDGTYSLTVNLYSKNGAGGPFPKNRVPAGMLLATRTLDFTVGSQQSIVVGPSHGGRQAVVGNEQWVVDSGQWVVVAQNPVNEEVVVRVLGKVGEEVELALVNLQGQTIQHRGLKLTSSEQNEVLNVRHAPTGLYILKAIKGDKVKTIKVVKVD